MKLKTLLLIWVFWVVLILGVLILWLFIIFGVVQAQEGCGEWFWQFEMESIDLLIKIRADTLWQVGDSVWVPKSCGDMFLDGVRDSAINKVAGLVSPPMDKNAIPESDTVRQRQMTTEEKVDMLFDMVLSLTAEINYLKSKPNK